MALGLKPFDDSFPYSLTYISGTVYYLHIWLSLVDRVFEDEICIRITSVSHRVPDITSYMQIFHEHFPNEWLRCVMDFILLTPELY